MGVMEPLGKVVFFTGLAVTALGLLLWIGVGKSRGGLLPGDLSIDRGNVRLYFPIVTCVVVSVVLTLLLRFLRK